MSSQVSAGLPNVAAQWRRADPGSRLSRDHRRRARMPGPRGSSGSRHRGGTAKTPCRGHAGAIPCWGCRASRRAPGTRRRRHARESSPRRRGLSTSTAGTTVGRPHRAPRCPPTSPSRSLLTTIGSPSAAAARAATNSPSGWTIPSRPIGARATGAGIAVPSTVTAMSGAETSRSRRGTIRHASNAARFARAVASDPADPAT